MDVEKNIDDEKKDAIVDQNENIRNDEGEIEDIEDIEESEESDSEESEETDESGENVHVVDSCEAEIVGKRTLSPTDFSKNSIISISRKAGIKCISQCGIEKVKTLLHEKIKVMNNHLASFYTGYGKTITKQVIIDFLDSEGIHFTHMVKE